MELMDTDTMTGFMRAQAAGNSFKILDVKLPLDADGVLICPGDVLIEHEDGHAFVVDGYEYDRVFKKWWVFENNSIRASVGNCTHKAETIEDILDEIQEKYIVGGASLEEYAGRIREAARREEVR